MSIRGTLHEAFDLSGKPFRGGNGRIQEEEDMPVLSTDHTKSVNAVEEAYRELIEKIIDSKDSIAQKMKRIEKALKLRDDAIAGLSDLHTANIDAHQAAHDSGFTPADKKFNDNQPENFAESIRGDRKQRQAANYGKLRESAVVKRDSDVRSFIGQITGSRVVLPSARSKGNFIDAITTR